MLASFLAHISQLKNPFRPEGLFHQRFYYHTFRIGSLYHRPLERMGLRIQNILIQINQIRCRKDEIIILERLAKPETLLFVSVNHCMLG